MTFSRPSGRQADQMRTVTIERSFTRHAEGSVLVSFGDTRVLCTASVENRVPGFLRGKGEGWVTAYTTASQCPLSTMYVLTKQMPVALSRFVTTVRCGTHHTSNWKFQCTVKTSPCGCAHTAAYCCAVRSTA